MTMLRSTVDTSAPAYRRGVREQPAQLAALDAELAKARAGGGPKYVERHHGRGKLLARERIELLLDRDSPFLELSPLAAWGSDYPVGASLVTGIGVVSGVECVIIANDPTVRGGASNPWTVRKALRADDIARENRLPLVNLVESGGADLPSQAEIFVPGGRLFRDLTRLSAAGIPTVALVFGNSTAGGAYVPGMSDHVVMVRDRSKVFLGGPPLVKMATGEDADDESLGGAEMHATRLGPGRLPRRRRAGRAAAGPADRAPGSTGARHGPGPTEPPDEPPRTTRTSCSASPAPTCGCRSTRARCWPGSSTAREFDEFKPAYGPSLVTGWASIHGYPVGVLANARGVLFGEEAQKAAQFIQLANQTDTPLVFLQNTTGYMVGTAVRAGAASSSTAR